MLASASPTAEDDGSLFVVRSWARRLSLVGLTVAAAVSFKKIMLVLSFNQRRVS